jgi:hypothetical protein
VYKHHADRRAHARRQDEKDDGLRRSTKVEQERRLTHDRRKTD